MNIYRYPTPNTWDALLKRPRIDTRQLQATVGSVLDDVRTHGDEAIRRLEARFDHVQLDALEVSEQEMRDAMTQVAPDLLEALQTAHVNISRFHEAQLHDLAAVETCPGVTCWQRNVGIERVGLYIPGGTAPLFSTVLMLAAPARIAGCREIILCSPPSPTGHIHPAILAAAHTAGVSRIFKIGGSQAIAAMAFGTESVPRVSKIFGPGNQYVMEAKQQVAITGTAIDMPAGPSEVCVIADDSSHPDFVAADLLSQAEHGIDSQVLLITTSDDMLHAVEKEIERQLALLPRQEIARKALENSRLVLVSDTAEAIRMSNEYAPEHLIIATADYEALAGRVVNAGSVFLGNWSCESAGDYASGTNHTLPTHGYAKAYSGLNIDSFCRKITFQHLSEEGIRSIGPTVATMAANEQLDAHRNAMALRIDTVNRKP